MVLHLESIGTYKDTYLYLETLPQRFTLQSESSKMWNFINDWMREVWGSYRE